MFNLIVTVIAVVAMIAVGIAGLTYLGPSFGAMTVKAQVAQFANGSAQVAGAAALYHADNGVALADDAPGSSVDALVRATYLQAPPKVPVQAKPGARWELAQVKGHAVVSIDLDDSRADTAQLCALAEQTGGGCVADMSVLKAD